MKYLITSLLYTVITVSGSDLDLRSLTLTGREKLFEQYYFRQYENIRQLLYLIRSKLGHSNVTRFISVDNLKNFNEKTHFCPKCIFHDLKSVNLSTHLKTLLFRPLDFVEVANISELPLSIACIQTLPHQRFVGTKN